MKQNKCVKKNCRNEVDIIVEGKPYCEKHNLERLNKMLNKMEKVIGNCFMCQKCGISYSEESGAYPGFICDNCGGIKNEANR